ncbi:Teneurin-2 [Triplophysa tibetana]|uniref:Teneurin-2 n=1 Tax=Triplophysa tibetana TaxID=1572043 RepID=A0A5A9NK60_9TELE|nr:Teneurin-2 [Triplophysa tibetana]KAA0709851.1 Teneurin-2 [Triplophysa tibetana]KAA0709852.1 Teneurin-2 [Triplophysa tibetana]
MRVFWVLKVAYCVVILTEYMDLSPFLSYFMSGNFTLAELGICEPTPHQNAYCPDLSLLQRGYSLSASSDVDSDPEGPISPERAIQLWEGHGIKSRRSSGLSSRDNSALTLTDSENENKSDDESGGTYLGLECTGRQIT